MGKGRMNKSDRMLRIYFALAQREVLSKWELMQRFDVCEKTVNRDISALRCFLADQGVQQEIIYDSDVKGYRLQDVSSFALENSETLAVCKILLESRSMRKDELFPILDKLIDRCVPEQDKKAVGKMIANEEYHYIGPHHDRRILPGLWEIGQAIQGRRVMEIQYERLKEPKRVTRRVLPVGIMFSEYYFYLTAFLEDRMDFDNPDDLYPTIYRIDRIRSFKVLDEHFYMPHKNRFEEGEFRKQVQFMYGGKLEQIKFRYTGPSLEAVLDRLPTAKVIGEDGDGWIVKAKVFGKGVEMWLRSQGNLVSKID